MLTGTAELKQGNLISALTSTQTLRERAKQFVVEGAVIQGYGANKEEGSISQKALATELVCLLSYKRHYHMAKGINSESVKAEFLEHADEMASLLEGIKY